MIWKELDAVILGIGHKCNNYCVMCYNPKFMRSNPSTEDIKKEIDGLNKLDTVYLTGGEPTIRPDIFDIIDHIKERNIEAEINIITNGRMLAYPDFAKKIVNSGVFKIITEIHGSKPELHDRITKVSGSFEQTVRGIRNLLNFDARVDIRIVIHKMNYKDLPNIAWFISQNFAGIDKVVMFPINIIGDAYKNRDKVVATYTQIIPYVEKATDILNKNDFMVKLCHTPFCAINKKYWHYIKGVSTKETKLTLPPRCKQCIKKKECPKIWKTYAVNIGIKEFKPVLKTNKPYRYYYGIDLKDYKKYLNSISKDYESYIFRMLDYYLPTVPKCPKVMDAMCGILPINSCYLKKYFKGGSVKSYDIIKPLKLKLAGERVKSIEKDLSQPLKIKEKFDVIFTFRPPSENHNLLHSIYKNIYTVLKRNGILFATTQGKNTKNLERAVSDAGVKVLVSEKNKFSFKFFNGYVNKYINRGILIARK